VNDWLEGMLQEMPAQPYPTELTTRIQAQLSNARRRSRWVEWGIRLAMLGAGLGGVLLTITRLDALMATINPIMSIDPVEWTGRLLHSPETAWMSLIGSLTVWISQLSASSDPGLLLSLGLLAVPAFYAVIVVLSDKIPHEGAWI
jgi:hypothetical protein